MNIKRIPLLLLAIALLALASCKSSPKPGESVSNINHALQASVAAILERHLVEYDAMDGVAIVMETESGMVRFTSSPPFHTSTMAVIK